MEIIDNMQPRTSAENYSREIFFLYLELGSQRAVSRKLGIPKDSIRFTVNEFTQSIMDQI
jgi:hypothetical protein